LSDNGAANFSGQLTLGSTITNGTNTYTLPSATGTLALTSALSGMITGSGTTNYLPKFTGASTIGNSNLINDASGNLGLGVTPSAWGSGISALEFAKDSSISSHTTGGNIFINCNTYYNGTNWVYATSSIATSQYQQRIGEHRFYTAPSGTAGNAISFTQAMTLGSNSGLSIGTTTAAAANGLLVAGAATFSSSVTARNGSSGTAFITTNAVNADFTIETTSGGLTKIGTSGNALSINSGGGNVGIGTTSPNGKLNVSNGGAEGIEFWVLSATATNLMQSYNRATSAWNSLEYKALDHIFYGSGTERMRITSGGNVGIGTTSPSEKLHINRSDGAGVYVRLQDNSGSRYIGNDAGAMVFLNGSASEQMRITSGGDVLVGTTSNDIGKLQIQTSGNGSSFSHSLLLKDNSTNQNAFLVSHKSGETRLMTTYSGSGINSDMTFWTTTSAGSQSERMRLNSNGNLTVYSAETTSIGAINSNNTNGNYGYYSEMGGNTNNTSSFHFVGAISGVGNKIQICGNGNVQNTNNSYGAISDISLKENIIDTTSKLADLLKVKIRNYNLIGDDKKQIGVIAQELETIFPSMIDTDTITGLKSVKYSVFVPMLIKAIQELNDKIK
jgi:hypothetical protein